MSGQTMCGTHQRPMLSIAGASYCPGCLAAGSTQGAALFSSAHAQRSARDFKSRTNDAGVPSEFGQADFAGYEPATATAARVVTVLQDYCAKFDAARLVRKGFLFIGMPGTGKTHLACAMVNALLASGHKPVYTSLPRLTRLIRASYSRGRGADDVLKTAMNADFLVLDEVDLHGASDSDYNILYDLVNSRYERSGFPTLAISNRTLEHLERDLDERIVTRILANTAPVVFAWSSRRVARRPASFAKVSE